MDAGGANERRVPPVVDPVPAEPPGDGDGDASGAWEVPVCDGEVVALGEGEVARGCAVRDCPEEVERDIDPLTPAAGPLERDEPAETEPPEALPPDEVPPLCAAPASTPASHINTVRK